MQMKLVLLVSFMISGCFCALDIKKLKLCKRDNKDLNGCLRVAIQDAFIKLGEGLPSYPTIEPLSVPSMVIGEGATGAVHVVQNFTNVQLHGLSKQIVELIEASIDPKEYLLKMNIYIPSLTLAAQYNFNGHILVLPITGNGNATVMLEKLKVHIIFEGHSIKKNGKDYLEINHVKMTLKPKKVTFNFDNLFNGDERLGNEMNKVLNENWDVVFEDVRGGYEESLAIIVQNVCNLIYHRAPYDELYPL